MFYEKIKNKRGITLIALVVTIVVLLILAGVTISMLTGENGIINQAKNAKEESLKSELEELVDLTLMEYKTDKASGKNTDLGDLLDSKVGKDFDAVTEDDESYIVEKNGYDVTVSKDGIRLTEAGKVDGVRPKLEVNTTEAEKVTISVQITNKTDLGSVDSIELLPTNTSVDTIVSSVDLNAGTATFEVEKNDIYKVLVKATTEGIQKQAIKSVKVTYFDIIAPKATITLDKKSIQLGKTVNATVTHIDDESGVNVSSCKYIWNTSNANIGIDEKLYTEGTFSAEKQSISKTFNEVGTYYLHVLTVDNRGNKKETISDAVVVFTYIGCYVDTDNDNTPDGVIFADLAVGGNGTALGQRYTIPQITGTREYKVSEELYNGKFGNNPVLTPIGEGASRFYVMSLNNVGSTQLIWYYSAYNKINDWASITSKDFGKGKQNTMNMINAWNDEKYGAQNSKDIWGLIQSEVSDGWFVPSVCEWAAFTGAFNIGGNYGKRPADLGLNAEYWSSSLVNEYWCMAPHFDGLGSTSQVIMYGDYLRLCTIF